MHVSIHLSIPSTWDFSMNLNFAHTFSGSSAQAFNSLYLGFFHESIKRLEHRLHCSEDFQFPLLGIFPWIQGVSSDEAARKICLSIPSTWDFSMNHVFTVNLLTIHRSLSIPSTWDFSMNLEGSQALGRFPVRLSIPSTWDFSMNLSMSLFKASS